MNGRSPIREKINNYDSKHFKYVNCALPCVVEKPYYECRHPYTVDYNILYSLSVRLLLVDKFGDVVTSAAEALRGSPTERFTIPFTDQEFSILFRNEDMTVCEQWRIIGFKISVENVKWYKVRIGQRLSRKVQVRSWR